MAHVKKVKALYLVRLRRKSAISMNVNDLIVRFQIACQRGLSARTVCNYMARGKNAFH